MVLVAMMSFQIRMPVQPGSLVVSVVELDYKCMNAFRLRFHEPLY